MNLGGDWILYMGQYFLNGQHAVCFHMSVMDRALFCFLKQLASCSSASSPLPGSPAAGHAAPEPSDAPSSARCCSPSPRLWRTCQMTSARGPNLRRASPATVTPALVSRAKEKKAKGKGRKRRRRRRRRRNLKERNCTTGNMKDLRSARRVVGEVWIGTALFNE